MLGVTFCYPVPSQPLLGQVWTYRLGLWGGGSTGLWRQLCTREAALAGLCMGHMPFAETLTLTGEDRVWGALRTQWRCPGTLETPSGEARCTQDWRIPGALVTIVPGWPWKSQRWMS